ncbi:ubiquitin-specific protease doa4, partial [Kickxella alabastrina]
MPPLVSNTNQDTALREAITPQTVAVHRSDEPQSNAQSLECTVVQMAPSNLPLADHDISNSNRSNSASPVQELVATGEPKPRRKSLVTALNQQVSIDPPVSASSIACLKSAEPYMDEARLHQESGDLENAHLKYQLSSNIIAQLPKLHGFKTISEGATYDGVRSESDTLMLDDLKRLTEELKTHQYVDPHGDSVPDTRVDAVEQLDMMESGFAQMYPDHQLSHSESNAASSSPMHQRSQLVAGTEDSTVGTSQTLTLESQWMATQQSKFEEIDAQARIIDAEARRITSRSPRSRSNTIPGIAVISHGTPPILPAMEISPNFETTDKSVSSEFIDATASTCMPLELWNLLDKSRTAADGHPTVLILDVRPHQDFIWGQIDHKYTVNIEPAALHKGCTSADIESSLVLVSDDQQAWFHQRGDFDIVVYTSQSAHLFSDRGSMEIAAMEALNSAIYRCEFLKPPKHQPLFLIGGFDSWVQKMGKHQCLWSDEARRSMARSPFPESVQTWSASSEPVTLSVSADRISNTSPRTERLSTLAFHAPTESPSGNTILSCQTLHQAVAVSSPVPPILQIPALVSATSAAALVVASSMDDATVSTPVSGSVFDFFQQRNNYNPQWQQQQLQQQMDCRRQAAYTLSTQGYNAMSTHVETAPAPALNDRDELSSNLPTFNATSDRLSAAPVDPAADNSQIPDEPPALLPEVPDNTTDLNQRSTVFDNPTYGFTGPAYSGRTNVNEYTAVSVPTDTHFATAKANHAENKEQQQQQMIAEPAKKRRQPPPIPTLRLPPKPEACVQQATLQTQTHQNPQLVSHVPNAPLPLKSLEYANSPPANQ